MAREKGLKTTADGIDGLLPHIAADDIRIAFDATSAYVHAENARKLQARGVVVVDLHPRRSAPTAYRRSTSPSTSASAR